MPNNGRKSYVYCVSRWDSIIVNIKGKTKK